MTTQPAETQGGIPIACSTDGVPLKWKKRCTQVALNNTQELPRDLVNLSETDVRRIINEAFAVWEASSVDQGLKVELSDGSSECEKAEYNQDGPNMNTVILASDWSERGYWIGGMFAPYDPAAFAVTTAWHNATTGEILDVDIEINEQRGPYIECDRSCAEGGCVGEKDTQDRQVVDLSNVLTHEVGHYYGLDHPALDPSDSDDERLSTMWAKAPAGEVCKRVLKEDDIQGLQTIYPAQSLEGTCDFSPYGGASLVCSGKEDGCSCSTSNSSQSNGLFALFAMGLLILNRKRHRQHVHVPK